MTQQFPTLSNYENASSWRRSLKDYFKEHNLLYIIDEKSKLCLDQPTLEDVAAKNDVEKQFAIPLFLKEEEKYLTDKANTAKVEIIILKTLDQRIREEVENMKNLDTPLKIWNYLIEQYVDKKDVSVNEIMLEFLQQISNGSSDDFFQTKSNQTIYFERLINIFDNKEKKDVLNSLFISSLILILQQQGGKESFIESLLESKDLTLDQFNQKVNRKLGNATNPIVLNSIKELDNFCLNCGRYGHNKSTCKRRCSICNVSTHSEKFCGRNSINKANPQYLNCSFIIDSGASTNIINKDPIQFIKETQTVVLPNGSTTLGYIIPNLNFENLNFGKALYCPKLKVNVLSVPQLTKLGFKFIFKNDECQIIKNNQILFNIKKENGLFTLKSKETVNNIIHERFGHLSQSELQKLQKIFKENNIKPPSKETISCENCSTANFKKRNIYGKKNLQVKKILECIHMDVWAAPKLSNEKFKYIVTFTDELTRFSCIYFIKNKSETLAQFIKYKNYAENKHSTKIKTINADNGGEFVSNDFKNLCEESGIEIFYSPPYTPEYNGIAERLNQTLTAKARALKEQSNIPWRYWPEIFQYSNLIRNISPTSILPDLKTPYHLWYNKLPKYKKVRAFGCLAIARNVKIQNKFDSQGIKFILIGHDNTMNGYKLLNIKTNRIYIRQDVKFNEDKFPLQENPLSNPIKSLPILHTWEPNQQKATNEQEDMISKEIKEESKEIKEEQKSEETESQSEETNSSTIESHDTPLEENSNTSVSNYQQNLQNIENSKSKDELTTRRLRSRSFQNPIDHTLANISSNTKNHFIPQTVHEAKSCENWKFWKLAMEEEENSLIQRETFHLEDPKSISKEHHILPYKWVFALKYDNNGNITRYKARLVANGFQQQKGIDYDETFSPVARVATIRAFVSAALHKEHPIHQLDVKTAYLYGEIDKDIYMKQPKEFQTYKEGYCLKLDKSLYGLKQAGKIWYENLTENILNNGFTESEASPCLFYKIHEIHHIQ